MNCFSNPLRAVQGAVPGTQSLFNNFIFSIILFLICLFGFDHPVMAQTVHWQNEGDFQVGYQFSTAEDTIAANEQFSIKLYLEVLDPETCGGGRFSMVTDDRVSLVATPLSVPDPNWLDDAGVLGSQYTEKTGSDTVICSVWHFEPTLVSGSGWVLTVDFEVGDTALLANEVMAYFGGNLIMDENLDMKRRITQPEAITSEVIPYPNSSRAEHSLSIPLPKECTIEVRDFRGKIYFAGIKATEQKSRLESLPPGFYFLLVYDERKGVRKTLKFHKQ